MNAKIALWLTLAGLGAMPVALPPVAAAQPAANVVSPEVGADRRVTFRLLAPKAHDVRLTGEFIEGSQNLIKGEDGVWSVTIAPVEPEIYHYNFVIDGVRTIDPGNADVKTGSTPSTISSILEVRGSAPAFYDAQQVPHGEIRTHWNLRLLWVGCGKEDGAFAASKGFSGFLDEHQIAHTFRETSGAHTWMVWRRYLNEISPLLFR